MKGTGRGLGKESKDRGAGEEEGEVCLSVLQSSVALQPQQCWLLLGFSASAFPGLGVSQQKRRQRRTVPVKI